MPVPEKKRGRFSSSRGNHRTKQEFFQNRRSKKLAKASDSPGSDKWDEKKTNESKRTKLYLDEKHMHNETMERYYRQQKLFTNDEEYVKMFSYFRKGLPTTFRFTGIKQEAIDARNFMLDALLPKMEGFEVDGEIMDPPKAIPWYPHRLAWNFDFPRSVLRKSPELKRFHQYMVSETEMGNISRQEAVSMIPVLFLDVKSHHYVLDSCASPGSKTTQILEELHADAKGNLPKGLVVANDVNYKRAAMLVHQTQRISSPALIVTNHEAQHFPNLTVEKTDGSGVEKLLFDRILCDVPCSGDGTLRKNIDVWQSWSVMNGNSLHRTQLQILLRSIQLLKVGGRIVYSTCSLNPVENEAVVGEAIRRLQGCLRLINSDLALPDLKRRPGLCQWTVHGKNGELFASYEQATNSSEFSKTYRRSLAPSLFCSEEPNCELKKCMRFYPQDQNTGAFFVAVLEKTSELIEGKALDLNFGPSQEEEAGAESLSSSGMPKNTDSRVAVEGEEGVEKKSVVELQKDRPNIASRPKKDGGVCRRNEGNKHLKGWFASKTYSEEPFVFVPPLHPDIEHIRQFFKLQQTNFPLECLVVRGDKVGPTDRLSQLYLVNEGVMRALTASNSSKLRVVNSGLKVLSRNDKLLVHLRLQKERQNSGELLTQKVNLLERYSVEEIDKICCYRLHGNSLGVLGRFFAYRNILVTKAELIQSLREMTPKVECFSEKVQRKMAELGPGGVILTWNPALDAKLDKASPNEIAATAPISISSWLGYAGLNVYVNKHERKSLFLKLTGEILPDSVLQPTANASQFK